MTRATQHDEPLRVVFAGSPEFAAMILQDLAASAFKPVAVFTQPDRPTGRGRKLRPNPVKQLAEALELPVHQPASLRDEAAQALLRDCQPDILVVAAYGLILPQAVLDLPTLACVNVHASLLPRWRGAAPIERAIMAGDAVTGVCIMHMEAGLDTGPVYRCEETAVDNPPDVALLERQLAESGARNLLIVLRDFEHHRQHGSDAPTAHPQPEEGITYAHKLTADDRVIDWQRDAESIARQINALAVRMPARGAVNGCGIQFLQAQAEPAETPGTAAPGSILAAHKTGIVIQCGTGWLRVLRLKLEKGKGSALDAAAAINGYADILQPGATVAQHLN